jgi:hypothetical protein
MLSLHSTGASERCIAEILNISKTTVHNTIDELCAEAIQSIESIIQNIPYKWRKTVEGIDTLLRRTNDLLDYGDLEVSDRLSAIKVASDLAEKRLNLFTAPQIMQRAIQHQQKIKAKIEALQRSESKFDFAYEVESHAGVKAITKRKVVARRPAKLEDPVV